MAWCVVSAFFCEPGKEVRDHRALRVNVGTYRLEILRASLNLTHPVPPHLAAPSPLAGTRVNSLFVVTRVCSSGVKIGLLIALRVYLQVRTKPLLL